MAKSKPKRNSPKFFAAPGAPMSNEQASVYGTHLQALMEARGGLKPEDVVEDAKSPESPLHSWFVWDNRKAAEKWRLAQAGNMLRSIMTTVRLEDGTIGVRAFYNIVAEISTDESETPEPVRCYVTLKTMHTVAEAGEQGVRYALLQLIGWKNRYGHYREFMAITRAIEEIEREVEAARTQAAD